MTTMELLTIPGLDNSKTINKMRKESSARMGKSIEAQRRAAALMSAKSISKNPTTNRVSS